MTKSRKSPLLLAVCWAVYVAPPADAGEIDSWATAPISCSLLCEQAKTVDFASASDAKRNAGIVGHAVSTGALKRVSALYEMYAFQGSVTVGTWYVASKGISLPVLGPTLEIGYELVRQQVEDQKKRLLFAEFDRLRRNGTQVSKPADLLGPQSILRKVYEDHATPYDTVQDFVISILGEKVENLEGFVREWASDARKLKATVAQLESDYKRRWDLLKEFDVLKTSANARRAASRRIETDKKAPAAAADTVKRRSQADYLQDVSDLQKTSELFGGIGQLCSSIRSSQCESMAKAGQAATTLFAGIALIAAQNHLQGFASIFSGLASLIDVGGSSAAREQAYREAIEQLHETLRNNHREVMREFARVNQRFDWLAQVVLDSSTGDIAACKESLDVLTKESNETQFPMYGRVSEMFKRRPEYMRECIDGLFKAFRVDKNQTAFALRTPEENKNFWVDMQSIRPYLSLAGQRALLTPPLRLFEIEQRLAAARPGDSGALGLLATSLFWELLDANKVALYSERVANWHYLFEITDGEGPGPRRLLTPAELRKPRKEWNDTGKTLLGTSREHLQLAIAQQGLFMGHIAIPVLYVLLNDSIEPLYDSKHPLNPLLQLPALSDGEKQNPDAAKRLNDKKAEFRNAFVQLLNKNPWIAENFMRYWVNKELAASGYDAKSYLLIYHTRNPDLVRSALPRAKQISFNDYVDDAKGIRRGWVWKPLEGIQLQFPLPKAVEQQELLYMPTLPNLLANLVEVERALASYDVPKTLPPASQVLIKRALVSGFQF
jgi:hypothetical protein